MDWAEAKAIRAAAIKSMQDQIEQAEPIGLPFWLVSLMLVPLFLGSVAMGFLQMLKGALLSMAEHLLWFIVSPFVSLYLWCDLLVVSWWYFGCLCRKFAGEK